MSSHEILPSSSRRSIDPLGRARAAGGKGAIDHLANWLPRESQLPDCSAAATSSEGAAMFGKRRAGSRVSSWTEEEVNS